MNLARNRVKLSLCVAAGRLSLKVLLKCPLDYGALADTLFSQELRCLNMFVKQLLSQYEKAKPPGQGQLFNVVHGALSCC